MTDYRVWRGRTLKKNGLGYCDIPNNEVFKGDTPGPKLLRNLHTFLVEQGVSI